MLSAEKCKKEIEKIYNKKGADSAIAECQLRLKKDPNNADLHTILGDLYLEWHLDIRGSKKYVDEAITEYQRALEEKIDSPTLFYKIGTAFFHKNELDKALKYFHSAVEKKSDYADAYYMSAKIQIKKGNFQHAVDDIQEAIKYFGIHSAKAHFLFHTVLKLISYKSEEQTKYINKALWKLILMLPFDENVKRYFNKAILIKKEFWKAVFLLPFDKEAKKQFAKNRFIFFKYTFLLLTVQSIIRHGIKDISYVKKAIDMLEDAIDETPGFIPLYNMLGEVYFNIQQYEEAIYQYKTAIMLDSLDIPAYRGVCRCYEEMGDYDSAVETYHTLIKIHPYAAEYHSNLASILFIQGNLEDSIAHYQHAINLNPSNVWTSVVAQTLGYIYQECTDNLDAAVSSYQCAYALTPEDMDIYINLGKAFYDKQDLDNALTIYKRALDLAPHSAEIHCNIGYLYWDKGELDEAIKEYELSVKYDPMYAIPYNNMGVIYLDDYALVQQAVEYFTKAIEANPNYALAHYNLARALTMKGEKVEAAKHYQEAMDINILTQEMEQEDISNKLKELFE